MVYGFGDFIWESHDVVSFDQRRSYKSYFIRNLAVNFQDFSLTD